LFFGALTAAFGGAIMGEAEGDFDGLFAMSFPPRFTPSRLDMSKSVRMLSTMDA
jgi:hypothetical protein